MQCGSSGPVDNFILWLLDLWAILSHQLLSGGKSVFQAQRLMKSKMFNHWKERKKKQEKKKPESADKEKKAHKSHKPV